MYVLIDHGLLAACQVNDVAVMSFDVMCELVPVVNYPTHSAPSIKGGLLTALSPQLRLI